jgi:Predicted phosphatases
VESNNIKDQAFKTIFDEWSEHQRSIMDWHLSRNDVDRQEKFRYFVEEVLGQSGDEVLIKKLTERFSVLTREAIVNCPMVESSQSFLEDCFGKVPMFLVSATPQNELESILEKRCMDRFFKEVYGAPIRKTQILKKILKDENRTPEEMLYIGDTTEDQQSAKSLGIHFIGRKSDRNLNNIVDLVFLDFVKIREHFNQHFTL